MYINQCELAWVGSGIPASDVSRVQVTTLYAGLSGIALDYARVLPHDVRHNFTEFSKMLRERFQFPRVGYANDNVRKAFDYIEHGTETLEEYVEGGCNSEYSSESEQEDLPSILKEHFIDGLNAAKRLQASMNMSERYQPRAHSSEEKHFASILKDNFIEGLKAAQRLQTSMDTSKRYEFCYLGDDNDHVWKPLNYLEQATNPFEESVEVGRNLAHASESEERDPAPILMEHFIEGLEAGKRLRQLKDMAMARVGRGL